MRISVKKLARDNKGMLAFIILMAVFRSAVADWNVVPTGSMKPTILEGDRILVDKLAYDLRLPFTHISLHRFADPQRGDIIIFDSEAMDMRLVKRVVGIPGDIVAMYDNTLVINGQPLHYKDIAVDGSFSDRLEDLQGVVHEIRTDRMHPSRASTFAPVQVPEGYYLALGDNRDNSSDSRFIGFIPREEIVGRSRRVVMSLDYDDYYLPRSNRFFQPL